MVDETSRPPHRQRSEQQKPAGHDEPEALDLDAFVGSLLGEVRAMEAHLLEDIAAAASRLEAFRGWRGAPRSEEPASAPGSAGAGERSRASTEVWAPADWVSSPTRRRRGDDAFELEGVPTFTSTTAETGDFEEDGGSTWRRRGPAGPALGPLQHLTMVIKPIGHDSPEDMQDDDDVPIYSSSYERACSNWMTMCAAVLSSCYQYVPHQVWSIGGTTSMTHQGTFLDSSSSGSLGQDVVRQVLMDSGSKPGRRSSVGHHTATRQPKVEYTWQTFMLHPNSWQRTFWMALSMFALSYEVVMLSLEAFDMPHSSLLDVIEIVLNAYWTLDIGSSFITGVFVDSNLIYDPKVVAKQYLRSWFFLDLVVVCFGWIGYFQRSSLSDASALKMFRTIRYCKLLRLAKLEVLWRAAVERLRSAAAVLCLRASGFLIFIALWVHLGGCMWYAVGTSSDEGWVSRNPALSVFPLNYAVSVHWAATQMQGNVDIYPTLSVGERFFAGFHLLGSIIVLAMFVGKLTTIMHTFEAIKEAKSRQLNSALHFLQAYNISSELSMSVRKYLEWKQVTDSKSQRNMHEAELMRLLPATLRRSLLDESRSPLLIKNPVFGAFRNLDNVFFQRFCCDALMLDARLPDEVIFSYGMLCDRMYTMVSGQASYLKYGLIMRALMDQGRVSRHKKGSSDVSSTYRGGSKSEPLREGRMLCEHVLWTPWVHVGDFNAVSHVSLLYLELNSFKDLLTLYPAIQRKLSNHAQFFVYEMNRFPNVTDLFDSRSAFHHETVCETEDDW